MKVDQLKYIDSMQFINISLANFAKNLRANRPITRKYFKNQNYTDKQIDLLCRKESILMNILILIIDS